MATDPKSRDEVREALNALMAYVDGDWSKIIHSPSPMTDEEWAQKVAEDERFYEELLREEAEWRAAHPGETWVLASDVLDEDRGPR